MNSLTRIVDAGFKEWLAFGGLDDYFLSTPWAFAEAYVAYLIKGKWVGGSVAFDVLGPNGDRLEIKFSTLQFAAYLGKSRRCFQWRSLRGRNNGKDGRVDYEIFCAFKDDWRFWVVPYSDVVTWSCQTLRLFDDEWSTSRPTNFSRNVGPYLVGGPADLSSYFEDRMIHV